jgi:hypothetical protein
MRSYVLHLRYPQTEHGARVGRRPLLLQIKIHVVCEIRAGYLSELRAAGVPRTTISVAFNTTSCKPLVVVVVVVFLGGFFFCE